MEFVSGVLALGIVAQVMFWVVVGVLFPVFWVWMLADAALRPDHGYASGSTEKIIWIVLIVLFQIAALAYFPLVYMKGGTSGRTMATAL